MFRGRFPYTLDPKGRLSIPAKFRVVLAQYGGDRPNQLIVVPNDHALEIHPLAAWEQVEDKLNGQSLFSPDRREFARLFMSRAKDVEVDGAGRVLLPPDTRKLAGLEKDVWIVGGGEKLFEVWDRARFEEYERLKSDALPSLFQKLSANGV